MSQIQGAIAATRFGMGARPGEIAAASSDPRGWLKAQIKVDAGGNPSHGLLSAKDVFKERQEAYAMGPPGTAGTDQPTEAQRAIRQQVQREARDGLQKEVTARSQHAA